MFGNRKANKEIVSFIEFIKEFYEGGADSFAKNQVKWNYIYKEKEKDQQILKKREFFLDLDRELSKKEEEEFEYVDWYVKKYDIK